MPKYSNLFQLSVHTRTRTRTHSKCVELIKFARLAFWNCKHQAKVLLRNLIMMAPLCLSLATSARLTQFINHPIAIVFRRRKTSQSSEHSNGTPFATYVDYLRIICTLLLNISFNPTTIISITSFNKTDAQTMKKIRQLCECTMIVWSG